MTSQDDECEAFLLAHFVYLNESVGALDARERVQMYRSAIDSIWSIFDGVKNKRPISFPVIDFARVEDGCWIWNDQLNIFGYPTSPNCKTVHRRLWEIFWNDGNSMGRDYQAHHRCENKRCVNPHHIESVTEEQHLEIHGITPDVDRADWWTN